MRGHSPFAPRRRPLGQEIEGFQGTTCELPPPPGFLSMSVSKFSSDGAALSPPDGIRRLALINQPQGTVSDRQGNIWVANCSGQSVTVIPAGDPQAMWNIDGIGSKPFDLAFDTRGHAWVTVNNEPYAGADPSGGVGSQAGTVVELPPDGSIVGEPIKGAGRHLATNGYRHRQPRQRLGVELGCHGPAVRRHPVRRHEPPDHIGDNGEGNQGASITFIRPLGKSRRVTTFGTTETDSRGGLALPWGIAIDGDDNVWIANFQGQQLTELCGARKNTCPPGTRTGDPISPDTGYSSDALVRNTAVEIGPSGNVWATNNWILNAEFQTNPGGHELVVFIGLAEPIKTPLIGPPERAYALSSTATEDGSPADDGSAIPAACDPLLAACP